VLPSGVFALPQDRPGNRCCYYSARAGSAVYAQWIIETRGGKAPASGFTGGGIL